MIGGVARLNFDGSLKPDGTVLDMNPLLEIANHMESLGGAIDQFLNETATSPDPSNESLAAFQAMVEATRRGEAFSPGNVDVDSSVGLAWLTTSVAADHLRATPGLFRVKADHTSVHRFAILSIFRVILESSAITFWLVDNEIPGATRSSRALTLVDNSRRLRRLADSDAGAQQEDLAYLEAIRNTVIKEAERLHLSKIREKLESGSDLRIPAAVDMVRGLFRSIHKDAAGEAVSAYRLLSEPMHGNILGIMIGYAPTGSQLHPNVSNGHIARTAYFASYGAYLMMLEMIQLMGWDLDRWRTLAHAHIVTIERIALSVEDVE